MKRMKKMFVSVMLLTIFGCLSTAAQSLVFHLAGGAKITVSLPATFTVTPSGDKLVIDGGGSVVELAKDDVMCVTYRGKKGDVNEDATVDVADIATIIDIMAGKDEEPQPEPDPETGETKTFTANGVSFTMIGVEGGTFQMGSDDSDEPVHQVTVSSFCIGQTEVTQELWYAVMGQKPTSDGSQWSSTYGIGDNLPTYYVSWEDCQEFITKLNQLSGQKFRLPTEAEWEYAARGGNKSKGYKYSGSNTIGDVAWYYDNSGSSIHNVATKQANELGLYDMSGNVYEWCSDWSGSYISDAQTNPTGPASGFARVFRGGSWDDAYWYCCVTDAVRYSSFPSHRYYNLGLRLAL